MSTFSGEDQIAPQDWDEQGKRQVNDKLDAQVMCRRLSEYLAGHRKALSVLADSFARGGGKTPPGADARAIAAADPAHAGDGRQPFAAKGNGGDRALVERHNLGADLKREKLSVPFSTLTKAFISP